MIPLESELAPAASSSAPSVSNSEASIVIVSLLFASSVTSNDTSCVADEATADDAAYAIMELDGDIVAQLNSSWTVRVKRDDLLKMQVDGTEGSAVAGFRECKTQHHANTPKPVWNPDTPTEHDFHDDWETVPDNREFENAFKQQWEQFVRHVVAGEPFPWDLFAGARRVRLTEASHRAWKEGQRVIVDELPT